MLVGVRDERAAFALAALVAQHGALLDGALCAKHLSHILLGVLFVQHADEEFAFYSGQHPRMRRAGGGREIEREEMSGVCVHCRGKAEAEIVLRKRCSFLVEFGIVPTLL